jgi:hypothetical protein
MKPNQERGWRGIVPLHSTRLDVEKLIGPPNTPDGSMYDPGVLDPTVDRIFVEYSTGDCSKKRNGGYNVPIGTVIQIAVTWSEKRNFSELQIDKSSFEKSLDSEIPEIVYYSNMNEGILYTVEKGRLKSTHYFSSKEDSHLRCTAK